MTTENTTITIHDFSFEMLLHTVFDWSYDNDVTLYKNLDYIFEAFHIRNSISQEEKKQIHNADVWETHSVMELLLRAIALADYEDAMNFRFTFIINNNSTNKAHYTYDWKYSKEVSHSYSALIPAIETKLHDLKEEGLDTWHKSTNHKKHQHFRWWINHFMEKDQYFPLRFFIQHTGNTRCFDTLHAGSNNDQLFPIIMQYMLDHNICPNPHYKKIEVPDYVNPDNHHERTITSSGRQGGFNYLVYLTGDEMKEIYKTKINKRKLSYMDKAFWGYVNAVSKEKETKFYLFVS